MLKWIMAFFSSLWDPDYTRVTPAERAALEEAEKEIAKGQTVPHDAIDW